MKKSGFGPTDRPTDRPSYRNAWTHLISEKSSDFWLGFTDYIFFANIIVVVVVVDIIVVVFVVDTVVLTVVVVEFVKHN